MRYIAFVFLFFVSRFVLAADYACVQYQRVDFSWGDAYKVPYSIVKGSDIQRATNDYVHYNSYAKYAIVEWPNGGYSAMELELYQNDISDFSYSNTKDQSGRTYRIKKAPSYGECSKY